MKISLFFIGRFWFNSDIFLPLVLNIFVNYSKFFSLYIVSMCRYLNVALFLKIFIHQFYYCNFAISGTYSTINFDLYFV